MSVLTSEELIHGIENCLHVTPHGVSQATIDRYVDNVRQDNIVARTDSPETDALLTFIKDYLVFIDINRIRSLLACEIYVVPFSPCIAYSEQKKDRNRIVISTGQLDLISSTIALIHFDGIMPAELNTVFPFDKIDDLPVKSATTILLYYLVYRFYRNGEPLPDFYSLLDEQLKAKIVNLVKGAFLFVLLHELGHLELGHNKAGEIRPMSLDLLINQDLSRYQQQEFEADQFTLDCFKPDEQVLCSTWMILALEFFSQMDCMTSRHGEFHPISINRLYQIHTAKPDTSGENDDPEMESYYHEQGERYQLTEQHNLRMKSYQRLPFLDSISRETLVETIEKLGTYLELANIDITQAINGNPSDWCDYTGIKL